MKGLTSTLAHPANPADAPQLTQSEIKRLYLYAGEGTATAWQQILNQAALGHVELFEARAAVKESGGSFHPTTMSIDGMRGDLAALLSAPLSNREYLTELYDLPLSLDTIKLRQQRAAIFSEYEQNPTFENLIAALHARVRIEPLFGINLQEYFLSRNINLPLDLFTSDPTDPSTDDLIRPPELLPRPEAQAFTADQGDSIASCIVRQTVLASASAGSDASPALPPSNEPITSEDLAFPPAALAAGLSYAQAPLSGGTAWFYDNQKSLADRVPLKRQPVILLCCESGSGTGYSNRVKHLARSLNDRGARCVVSVFDRRVLSTLSEYADDVVPAPQERFGREQPPKFALARNDPESINFASYLWRLGFWRKSTVLANFKAWDKIISRVQPAVVVADFAPYALLAASGRIPTLTIGHGLSVPAVADGFFTLNGQLPSPLDQAVQADLFETIGQVYDLAGVLAPASIPQALCGDEQCPATLPALDPRYALRSNALSPPVIDNLPPLSEGRGRETLVHMGEEPAEHIGAIAAVAKACPKAVLYASPSSRIPLSGLPANLKLQRKPFTAEEIAMRAVLLVHYGGAEMTHLAALTGVPQLIAYRGGVGWHNAKAVSRLNAGAGHSLDDMKAEELADLAATTSSTVLYSVAARSWAEDSQSWVAGRRGEDVISEKIMLAVV